MKGKKSKQSILTNVLKNCSMQEGEVVRMTPKAHNNVKRWVKAQVEKQVDVRSFAVRTEDGRQYRRNRKHLPKSQESFILDRAPAVIEPPPSAALPSPHVPLKLARVEPPQAPPYSPGHQRTPRHHQTQKECQYPQPKRRVIYQ